LRLKVNAIHDSTPLAIEALGLRSVKHWFAEAV